MADTIVTPSSGLDATYEPKKRTPNQVLGKDDFLKLMITQLQHQDPLNPQDNTEQLAQQAEFSSLEQMQNLNTSMEKLISTIQGGNRSSAISMIGMEVQGFQSLKDGKGEALQKEFSGWVKGIDFSTPEPTIVVKTEDSELRVPQSQITFVKVPETKTNPDNGSDATENQSNPLG